MRCKIAHASDWGTRPRFRYEYPLFAIGNTPCEFPSCIAISAKHPVLGIILVGTAPHDRGALWGEPCTGFLLASESKLTQTELVKAIHEAEHYQSRECPKFASLVNFQRLTNSLTHDLAEMLGFDDEILAVIKGYEISPFTLSQPLETGNPITELGSPILGPVSSKLLAEACEDGFDCDPDDDCETTISYDDYDTVVSAGWDDDPPDDVTVATTMTMNPPGAVQVENPKPLYGEDSRDAQFRAPVLPDREDDNWKDQKAIKLTEYLEGDKLPPEERLDTMSEYKQLFGPKPNNISAVKWNRMIKSKFEAHLKGLKRGAMLERKIRPVLEPDGMDPFMGSSIMPNDSVWEKGKHSLGMVPSRDKVP